MDGSGGNQNVAALAHYLKASLSRHAKERDDAAAFLSSMEAQPGWGVLILQLIESFVPAQTGENPVQQAAAVLFKNYVRRFWAPNSEDDDSGAVLAPTVIISDSDRAVIRSVVFSLALRTQRAVKRQLDQSIALIAEADFPGNWPELLPAIVEKMKSDDFVILRGVLEISDALFKRYRGQFLTKVLVEEVTFVLDHFAEPLLAIFRNVCGKVSEGSTDKALLEAWFEVIIVILSIIYSLNCLGLSDFFADHMKELLDPSLIFLSYENPLLCDEDEEREPELVDRAQAQVCEIVSLYVEKSEKEFEPHLLPFVSATWNLLLKLGPEEKHDVAATAAIRFLTVVASGVHHSAFASGDTLKTVCESVIIPNMKLREVEEDLFGENPLEYLRRDLEGVDTETRRGTAFALVQSLCKHYAAEVTQVFSQYVVALLGQYGASPKENWKAKDVAIFLITALAVPHAGFTAGASTVSALVDVVDFYRHHVLPELRVPDQSAAHPILTAGCLKFVTLFRNQLCCEIYREVIPLLVVHMSSSSYIVYTYACACLERILTVQDRLPTGERSLRFGRNELKPLIGDLLTGLFQILERQGREENVFAMKAVMRICSVAQSDMAQFTAKIIDSLNSILRAVCKNPRIPDFNHYMFESISALFRFVSKMDPGTITAFEELLFPPFTDVLQMAISEFMPYVFQIIAQMLEAHAAIQQPGTSGVPEAYRVLFLPLLNPSLWERSSAGNVPPLIRLLSCYVRLDGGGLATEHISGLLGIFQKLVASRTNDHEGITLLNSILLSVPPETVLVHLGSILRILLYRLQTTPTTKFTSAFLLCLSTGIIVLGPDRMSAELDAIQPGLFLMLVEQVWLKNVRSFPSRLDRKTVCIAIVRVLIQGEALRSEQGTSLWGQLLYAMIEIESSSASGNKASRSDAEEGESEGYSSKFSRLFYARKEAMDPVPNVPDPGAYLATELSLHAKEIPILSTAVQSIPAGLQDAFFAYFARGGIPISAIMG